MIGAFMEDGDKDIATIVSVYVPVEKRKQGISGKLMESILIELSGKSYLKKVKLAVNKEQIPAVNLYKKFGFTVTGKQNFKMGNGESAEELVMEKELSS